MNIFDVVIDVTAEVEGNVKELFSAFFFSLFFFFNIQECFLVEL